MIPCPLCGGRVLYESAMRVECVTPTCENVAPEVLERARRGRAPDSTDLDDLSPDEYAWILGLV